MNKTSWSIIIGVLVAIMLLRWLFIGGTALAFIATLNQAFTHSVDQSRDGDGSWSYTSSTTTINSVTITSSRAYTQRRSQTYRVASRPSIVVENKAGDITLRQGRIGELRIDDVRYAGTKAQLANVSFAVKSDGQEVRITGSSRSVNKSVGGVDITITAGSDAVLKLSTGVGRVNVTGFDSRIDAHSASGDITVAQAPGHLNLDTDVGTITIKSASGVANARSGSGDIRVTGTLAPGTDLNTDVGNIDVSDTMSMIDAHSGSGNVTLSGGVGNNSRATTDVGNIEVSGVNGSIRANSGSGNVDVTGHITGGSDISSSVGNVDVTLDPPNANLRIDASTSVGSVGNDYGLAKSSDGGSASFSGTIGDGSEGSAHITSGSGNVSLNRG